MSRPGLDRDRIVAAALDLLDEVGLDRLTTRALAERLGVRSPALYWHFRNKDDLVAAMAEAMSLELPDDSGPPPTRPSRAAVAQRAIERGRLFRRVLLSRRDGARVHAGSRPPAARLSTIEAQIDLLCRIGFDPTAAARITLAVSRFVVGWVLEEQSAHDAADPPDLNDYPLLSATSAVATEAQRDADFDACLTAVVRGLLAGGVRGRDGK